MFANFLLFPGYRFANLLFVFASERIFTLCQEYTRNNKYVKEIRVKKK